MKRFFLFCFHTFLILIITIITQIGGLIYLLTLFLVLNLRLKRIIGFFIFFVFYFISTFVIVPPMAKYFGREKVLTSESIKPTSYMTVLLNRNYVVPEMNDLLRDVDVVLKASEVQIRFLDANFPFFNGFPLLPHLSHKDGKKLDLSLVYETEKGNISHLAKSRSGYGIFVEPKDHEFNQVKKCLDLGYFQYDYPKYLTLGKTNTSLHFSETGTKKLINAILQNSDLEKLFIEPHLKQRLKLTDTRIRYHGCRAVRHDDHIHIQVR